MNLNAEQFETMYARFPGLQAYIIRCEVKNEHEFLNHLVSSGFSLNDYQSNRLKELEYFKSQGWGDWWK